MKVVGREGENDEVSERATDHKPDQEENNLDEPVPWNEEWQHGYECMRNGYECMRNGGVSMSI